LQIAYKHPRRIESGDAGAKAVCSDWMLVDDGNDVDVVAAFFENVFVTSMTKGAISAPDFVPTGEEVFLEDPTSCPICLCADFCSSNDASAPVIIRYRNFPNVLFNDLSRCTDILRAFSQPRNDVRRSLINLAHHCDLVIAFANIRLIDGKSIYPDGALQSPPPSLVQEV
jgi:hypothetical protein